MNIKQELTRQKKQIILLNSRIDNLEQIIDYASKLISHIDIPESKSARKITLLERIEADERINRLMSG